MKDTWHMLSTDQNREVWYEQIRDICKAQFALFPHFWPYPIGTERAQLDEALRQRFKDNSLPSAEWTKKFGAADYNSEGIVSVRTDNDSFGSQEMDVKEEIKEEIKDEVKEETKDDDPLPDFSDDEQYVHADSVKVESVRTDEPLIDAKAEAPATDPYQEPQPDEPLADWDIPDPNAGASPVTPEPLVKPEYWNTFLQSY